MRFVYMDEAGISSKEPITVVGAIIVDADRQWRKLEEHLQELVERYIEPEQRRDFVFHAKDIFHGSQSFPRERWPLPKRMEILSELVSIPRRFNLPLAYGYFRRKEFITYHLETAKNEVVWAHYLAFCGCAVAAEEFMRKEALPREVATIVAEDNDQARGHLKSGIKFLKDHQPDLVAQFPSWADLLPIRSIIDTVHLAAKRESPLLQIADACTFVLCRHLSGGSNISNLCASLSGSSDLIDMDSYPPYVAGSRLLVWNSRFGGLARG